MATTRYDQMVEESLRKLRQVEAARQQELDRQNPVKAKEDASRKEVQRYLERLVNKAVDTGNIKPHIVQAYLQRSDNRDLKYLQLAGKLLNHRYYGLSTETTRIDSASQLRWRGTEYSSPVELFTAIQELLGKPPLKGTGWLRELAHMALTASEDLDTYLANDGQSQTLYNTLKERYSDTLGGTDYNEEVLTAEDALFLAQLTGVF